MKVLRLRDPQEVARAGADVLARLAAEEPEAAVGLATGRTMIPFYGELARRHQAGTLDLSRIRGFNLDELLLPAGHPRTFRAFMERHAWGRTGLDRHRCRIPSAEGDAEEECRRYEGELQAAGGLRLAILGLGEDGHVAYNLPGQAAEEAHVVRLPAHLAERFQVPPERRPLKAVTLGLGAFAESRELLMMVTGGSKAEALQALLEGPAAPRWPCTLLRDHPRFTVAADAAALGEKAP